jgi:hypothetical protein
MRLERLRDAREVAHVGKQDRELGVLRLHAVLVMAVEQLVDDLAETPLVDVEDHDALVHAARHAHPGPRVIQDVLKLGDEPDFVEPERVPYEEQRYRKA